MNSFKKFNKLFVVCFIVFAVFLAGCNSNSQDSSANEAAAAQDEETDQSSSSANEETADQSSTTTNEGKEVVEEVTVRYSEVLRSIFYAPSYVAMGLGYFEEEGIILDMVTSQGSDKGAAAILSDTADVALVGPETTIFVNKEEGSKKVKVFYQLTRTDGSFLLSRDEMDNFDWSQLNGKTVLGWRPGSAPQMVMATLIEEKGLDTEVVTNIGAPALAGAFQNGQGDYIQVFEPVASQLISSGNAYYAASVGEAIGEFPYTSFIASDEYIAENPNVIQRWTNAVYKARLWVEEHYPEEVAEVIAPYFEGTDKELLTMSVERYMNQDTWPLNPVMTTDQYEILENTLVEFDLVGEDERVPYEEAVEPAFAEEVKE
ncbi:ABC transporter substrate-binding protein [Aquibacillus albus]|uniref:NitT/TauT family transport system substrate-binding protein n=1 Tax=Aquibacillus albus TaxID=1168171 RepID=A0ABS2N5K9_9BACI|nr:ABC transporter substrate-binding protein [Aquibacillus albus]MBM7573403.1 NitT/TauT family transport system substrate-binding protein [Aquibacillus albus]